MKVRFLVFLFSLAGASVLAQEGVLAPVPPPVIPQADLGIVKTYRPPTPAAPGAFVLTITNYGPATVPSFTFSDPLPAGAQWGSITFVPPLACTPQMNCVYSAPLSPGNSVTVTLPVTITTASANVVNCATVAPKGIVDPNDRNNRDCACIDVNPCRDVVIDITTGQQNGAQLPIGAPDTEWVTGTSGNTPSVTTANTWSTPSPPPGQYIRNPSGGTGTLPFRFNFTLGNDWRTGQCRVILQQFRADNCVRFNVDSNPDFAQTPTANCLTSAGWTVAGSASYVIPNPAGSHTLTANLKNNEGPMGLYVRGQIVCRCGRWPLDGTDVGAVPVALPN